MQVRQLHSQLEGQEGVHGSELLDMQRALHDAQRKHQSMQVQPGSNQPKHCEPNHFLICPWQTASGLCSILQKNTTHCHTHPGCGSE